MALDRRQWGMTTMEMVDGDKWAALEYEYLMYFGAKAWRHRELHDQVLRNAMVESELLHARILVDALTEYVTGGDNTDIRAYVSGDFGKELKDAIKALSEAYGGPKDVGCPRWDTNKRLAHLTAVRGGSNDNQVLFSKMEPALELVLKLVAVASKREGLLSHFRQDKADASIRGPTTSSTSGTN